MSEREEKAVALLREMVETDPYFEGYNGDMACYFCGCLMGEPHKGDCLYLRACELLEVKPE